MSLINLQPKIFLIGSMGAGKTTLGRLLANQLQLQFYDSDKVIEERCGASITWIFDLEGEAGFRKREAATLAELTQLPGIVLATGGGSILLPENRKVLKNNGKVIYLRTSLEQQLERTKHDQNRPLLQVDNPRKKLEELRKEREPLYLATAHLVIDTDKKSPRQIIKHIKNAL